MYSYKCDVCGGMCDAGELENGVCFDCRQMHTIKEETDKKYFVHIEEQHDGQFRLGGLAW